MKQDAIKTMAFLAVVVIIVVLLVMCGGTDTGVGGLY